MSAECEGGQGGGHLDLGNYTDKVGERVRQMGTGKVGALGGLSHAVGKRSTAESEARVYVARGAGS